MQSKVILAKQLQSYCDVKELGIDTKIFNDGINVIRAMTEQI